MKISLKQFYKPFFNFFSLIILMFVSVSSCIAYGDIGFDYPLGKPNGVGYRNGAELGGRDGWGYLEWNGSIFHTGEDWNRGSGSDDYGDPVFAIEKGKVISAKNYGGNWGQVVLISHNLKDGKQVWSQYSHLSKINVKAGDTIGRGEMVGAIGDAGGRWASHLHFEIRVQNLAADFWPKQGWSKEKVQEYYVNPSEFIRANRPLPPPVPQRLSLFSSGQGSAELTWDECANEAFDKYELYRSEAEGDKGAKIFETADSKSLAFKDSGLFASQDYYYTLTTIYKDGRTSNSNKITVNTPRETINLSNKTGVQRYVGASKGKIYWEDTVREKTSFPEKRTFYYYDLSEKTVKTIAIGDPFDNQIQGPYKPQIAGDWLCYYGKKSRYGNYEVYCRNLAAGNMSADIQISLGVSGDNLDPQISEEGILVWKGGTNGRLYWTNLNEGTEVHELTETTVTAPRIWGKNIIYQEKQTSSTFNLWVANIETGEKRLLKTGIDVSYSDIWEDRVVFTRGDKLYLINLNNPEKEMFIAATDHNNARIRDGKVVYSKSNPDASATVYVYVISTGKSLTVTAPLKYVPIPIIFENLVAFDAATADSPADMDIFLTYL